MVVMTSLWLIFRVCSEMLNSKKGKVGKGMTVGLNAVVTTDVQDNNTVVGVSARPLKKR